MRILIFTDGDSVNQVVSRLPPGIDVALVGAVNRPVSHDRLRGVAAAAGVPFLIQPRRSSFEYPAFAAGVADFRPDVIFVHSYTLKLAPELLRAAGSAFNLHGAPLPEYRGLHTASWAVANGERESGVTLHWINDDIDAGAVVARQRVPIEFTDTWVTLRHRLAGATETVLDRHVPMIAAGTMPRGTPQDEGLARVYHRRTEDDLRIDWSRSALEIYNLIRASVAPAPGAWFAGADGRPVRLMGFVPFDDVVRMQREMAVRTT